MTLVLRYAARSDVGLLRDENEDSGYAGPRLLAIADGMGGQAAGEVASSTVIDAITPLDAELDSSTLLDSLEQAVSVANNRLREMIENDPKLDGMGTTLTALYWTGVRLGLVHIGDSRAYLLRDGELTQLTHDHTFVQSLLDEGRITAEQAEHHPHRSLIIRALDGRGKVELDLSVREVRAGDRYLVCSDGLSSVVSHETIERALGDGTVEHAVETLVDLALRAGGPDNITCIVGELSEDGTAGSGTQVVGAAAERGNRKRNKRTLTGLTAAGRGPAPDDADSDDGDDRHAGGPPTRRRRWLWRGTLLVLVLAALAAGGYFGYRWTQQQYYIGDNDGQVAIYRGLSDSVLGVDLSSVYESEQIALADLPTFDRNQVAADIPADNLQHAQSIVAGLATKAIACKRARQLDEQPSSSPSGQPTGPTSGASGTHTPQRPTATGSPSGIRAASPTPRPTPSPSPSASPNQTPNNAVLAECGEQSG
ncbi:MAG TPA: PP2C family serine/threonine-protein phosphatase [Actinomycetes bacterium]|nr:PP2C family serine/threonine-protein phosphatase [Actinomycetes bacterium]